ncbi:unnamed protein product [Urochloa humidicola]
MDVGEDRISGIPDELLISILLRLRSTRAAARTGALSRRWRHVWKPRAEALPFRWSPWPRRRVPGHRRRRPLLQWRSVNQTTGGAN